MAKLGIHKRGSGVEKLFGQGVSHHKAADLHMGDQMDQHPMTSPIHPDLSSMAGGPSAPSSTDAANASVPSSGGMGGMPGLKKGGMVKGKHYAKGGLSSIDNLKLPRKIRSGLDMLKDGGSPKNWIKGAIKHPGSLRKALHVKEGQKIPAKKLEAASHKSGKLGQRARLAKTLKSFKS